jgi:hypothetical protein
MSVAKLETVIPVIVPPVIATAFAFWVDIVPKVSKAAFTNAVFAICVVLEPAVAVGAAGVPVKVGLFMSALEAIAEEIAINSLSISEPLTILFELPLGRLSFAVKFVALE